MSCVPGCDWPGCGKPGTHQLEVSWADGHSESLYFCRVHERDKKTNVRISIPPVSHESAPPATSEIRCGDCGAELPAVWLSQAGGGEPCPECASMTRVVHLTMTETLHLHDAMKAELRASDAQKWSQRIEGGDDFTWDHAAWGSLSRAIDRLGDRYEERLTWHDGTTLVTTAKLSDHETA